MVVFRRFIFAIAASRELWFVFGVRNYFKQLIRLIIFSRILSATRLEYFLTIVPAESDGGVPPGYGLSKRWQGKGKGQIQGILLVFLRFAANIMLRIGRYPHLSGLYWP